MSCKKFRISRWLFENDIVYTPQVKKYWIWWDMKTNNTHFMHLYHERGFVRTEEEARGIIEKYKKDQEELAMFERDRKLARRRFKKEQKIICVE